MATHLKHVGKLKNTGDRVVVVFRELLDENGNSLDSDNALVIYPDRLQDRYHDRIMDLLESDKAMETENFFEVLNSRAFHDGNNMLTFLHQKGFLKKVLVDNVILCPSTHERIPLREYNESLAQDNPRAAERLNEYGPRETKANTEQQARQPNETASRETHVTSDDIVAESDAPSPSEDSTPQEQAKSLLAQAHIMKQERDMLDNEIAKKESQAYKLDPSLDSEKSEG